MNIDCRTKLFGELCSLLTIEDSSKLWELLSGYQIKQLSGFESYDNSVKLFLNAKECEGLSKVTICNYTIALRSFKKYIGDVPPSNIDTSKIREYILYMKNDKGLKVSSIGLNIGIIRTFFSWLEDEHLILDNPMRVIRTVKFNHKDLRHGLSNEEQTNVRTSIDNKRDLALYEFFLNTGCRLSEVARIKTDDIDWDNKCVTVLGKGSKYRTVYFNTYTSEIVKDYLKESKNKDVLFSSNKYPYHALSTAGIEAVIKRIGRQTELSENLYPHKLRHTFATNALNNGMNLECIQKLLGHTNLSTTQVYAKMAQSKVKKEYEEIFDKS